MQITAREWNKYIKRMSSLSETAGQQMQEWVDKYGLDDREALIKYANAVVNKYAEGSSELACQMYDDIVKLSKKRLPFAEPIEPLDYGEVARNINGCLKQSPTGQLVNSTVQRMVKSAGADTTLKNAIRDKAQFAWIPMGDTCPFCLMLASNGWQYASKNALKGGHAEHIHANCDCQYAIRFDNATNVSGYNPDKYKEMYKDAEGRTAEDKVNYMRRIQYASNKDMINAQKREAYAERTENKEE